MPKEILVSVTGGEKRVAILENGKLDDFHIEVERQNSILGNIYKGRVESILPSINGAFINIGEERNGFLYLTDTVSPLLEEEISGPRKFLNKILNRGEKSKEQKDLPRDPKEQKEQKHNHNNKPPDLVKGQEVLVQVVKEPFGTKGARLTTHISLAGRFIVFMPYDAHVGVSKRIEDGEERHRLREVLKELNFGKNSGFIVRTVSLKQSKNDIVRDAKFLFNIWQKIKKLAEQKSAPALIYKEYDLTWRIVRDFLTEDVGKLVVDSPEEFQRLQKFVTMLIGHEMMNKIELHKGETGIFDAKNVSHELNKIYDTKTYLKSGAYIVIEPTEGLTVVDVNSGRFKTHASPEDAAFQVNSEAAAEIARQLRLKDIGGIIVIDFIDMTKDSHKKRVLQTLETFLAKDHAKTEVMKISPLGLVEMTRARTGKTIEALSFDKCPYCEGRGRVRIN